MPDAGELLCELKDALAPLGVERACLLPAAPLVVGDGIGMRTQLLVPVRLESIGNETVIGVDLHVAPAGKLGVIARTLKVFAAQGVGLAGASFELTGTCQRF